MDEAARQVVFTIMKIGAGLFVVGVLVSLAEPWLRARYVAKHGEGSLPPRQPPIWESIPTRDRWILAIFLGGVLLAGLVLRSLH